MSQTKVSGGFAVVPHWVFRSGAFTASQKLVYMSLIDRADASLRCWPSLSVLQHDTGLSRPTIVSAINALEAMGLVVKSSRTRPDGGYTSNLYEVVIQADRVEHTPSKKEHDTQVKKSMIPNKKETHEVEPFKDNHLKITNTPVAPKGQETEQPTFGANEDSTEDNPVESTPIDQPASLKPYDDGEYTPDFEMFWAMYPLHQDKRQAFKAYRRALRRASAMVIAAGAQKYASDPNLPEPRYIKHAATWLNADGWTNDPLPSRSSDTGNRARQRLEEQAKIIRHIQELEEYDGKGIEQ